MFVEATIQINHTVMSGGHYENMGLLSGNKPTGIRVQGGMTNKSNSKPVVTPTGAAPTAPSTAPATAAPLPALSQITEQNGTQIVSIPVRHQWNANLKDPPSVLPLEKVLAKLGHNGNDAHVSKIVLKETHSNAPSTLKATVAGVLPTDVNKPLHTIDALRDTEGNAFTYIVPPGKTEHNKVLLDNPLPPATDAVDFKDHVQINQNDLTKNVIDLPFLKNVQVPKEQSPDLYNFLYRNAQKGNVLQTAKVHEGADARIELSRDEYQNFLKGYTDNVASKIPKTKLDQHNITLNTWDQTQDFGRAVAETAVHAEARDKHLDPETKHEVVSVLEYHITPHKK